MSGSGSYGTGRRSGGGTGASDGPPKSNPGKTTVPVHLISGQVYQFVVTEQVTVFDLEKMVAMELGVPPKYCTLFGIFYEKCGYTQKPKPDAKLLEIFRRFNKDAREYGESKTKKLFPVLSGSRFVYKKWNFSRPGEIGIQSKATLALLFMQACHEITAAYARDDQWHYTYDQYMELAAVRAQVELGNYDASKHTRGFLTQGGLIDHFVPVHVLEEEGKDVETDIIAHFRAEPEREHYDAIRHFLNLARQSHFYGAVVIENAFCVHQNHRFDERLDVAVCSGGVVLQEADSAVVLWSFPWRTISRFGWHKDEETDQKRGDRGGFQVVGGDDTGRFTFETPEAAFLVRAIRKALDQYVADRQRTETDQVESFRAARADAVEANANAVVRDTRSGGKKKNKASKGNDDRGGGRKRTGKRRRRQDSSDWGFPSQSSEVQAGTTGMVKREGSSGSYYSDVDAVQVEMDMLNPIGEIHSSSFDESYWSSSGDGVMEVGSSDFTQTSGAAGRPAGRGRAGGSY